MQVAFTGPSPDSLSNSYKWGANLHMEPGGGAGIDIWGTYTY